MRFLITLVVLVVSDGGDSEQSVYDTDGQMDGQTLVTKGTAKQTHRRWTAKPERHFFYLQRFKKAGRQTDKQCQE